MRRVLKTKEKKKQQSILIGVKETMARIAEKKISKIENDEKAHRRLSLVNVVPSWYTEG